MAEKLTREEHDALWAIEPKAYTACCEGLEFPKMPHLHAENCPMRKESLMLFREKPAERHQFDQDTKLFRSGIRQVAASLDTWGRMNPVQGSLAQTQFVMANECLKADAELATLRAQLSAAIGERDRLQKAMEEISGCFDAADAEGWSIRIAEMPDESPMDAVRDLWNRRISYAGLYARDALSTSRKDGTS